MEKIETDNVGNKLDNINEAINKLIGDLNISRSYHEEFSMISPIHSFSDSLIDFQDNFNDFSLYGSQDTQRLLCKIHELLIENDRLHMRIEDLTGRMCRETDPTFEIRLTREMIEALNSDTEKFIRQEANQVLLKLKKDSFVIESSTKPEKIIYFTGDIKSKYFEKIETEKKQAEDIELGVQIIKKKAELEVQILGLAKKQQKTMELEEELGQKQQALEVAKLGLCSKLQEIENKNNFCEGSPTRSKRTCSCSDQTETSYFIEPISFNSSISRMLNSIEKVVKQQNKESLCDESWSKDVTVQYNHNKNTLNSSLSAMGRFTNKESYILDYFKQQSKLYDEKFKELNEYEKFLQETWVDTFGNGVMAKVLQRESQKNFNKSRTLKREREVVDEKLMRLEKLKQVVEQENKRLEFHRKKILTERQVLLSQQNDAESALEKIMNFKI